MRPGGPGGAFEVTRDLEDLAVADALADRLAKGRRELRRPPSRVPPSGRPARDRPARALGRLRGQGSEMFKLRLKVGSASLSCPQLVEN